MEQLFNEIQKCIACGMPELTLVDEDYGQLQTDEDTYPVTFPSVLINTPSINWETICEDYQRGTATVTIKLCLDCFDDTHYSSGNSEKTSGRLVLFRRLHNLIRRLEIPDCTELERQSTRLYSLPGAIKVYESTYECVLEDEPA